MKILIMDTYGESVLDWALRCLEDGHQVKWYFNSPQTDNVGKGLVERVSDWRGWMRWADIVMMTDNTKNLRDLDVWRKEGIKIIGPSQEAAAWELDRKLGMKILEKHGIACPPYREFSDYDRAIAYVKKEGRRFVSKPCGVETDKSLSYVSKDAADMVYMLERWKKSAKLKGSFILQEFIPGIEMGVGGWFGPGGFNEGWEENYEHKKLMNGDLGVATGEQGTVMQFVRKSKLATKVLKPLESALEKLGYLGCVDVNCIIDEKGKPWPLEFTMRLGWPAFNIQQALHRGDHAEWLLDLAEGRDAKCFDLGPIAVGVVMSIPDYPYSKITRKEVTGIPLYGVTLRNRASIHPLMMMAGEAPQMIGEQVVTAPCLVSAGDYVLVTTGTGSTVRTAAKGAYKVLKELSMPNSPMWRTDIGSRLKKQLPELHKHGYSVDAEY
jgi:phosphoribosylamine--glycine ligase